MKAIHLKLWVLVTILCASIPVSAYDFAVDGIYYNITSMSNLEVGVTYKELINITNTINGHYWRNDSYSGAITIPQTVNYNNRTFTVTSIEESAFGAGYSIDYTTYWNNRGCNIKSINLPPTVKSIAYCAFQNCLELSCIELPESLETIDDSAFRGSVIETVKIPNMVKTIGTRAFAHCDKLHNIIIGNGVIQIGSEAFTDNKSLLEVFCISQTPPAGLTVNSFSNSHSALEIYVPSIKAYGFGREYLTFPASSFDYTGQPHNIEWANNLKAYKCQIDESECQTDVNAGQYTKYLKVVYSNGIDLSIEIPYDYTINKAPMTLTVNNMQREYGDPNPAFTYEISGFVNEENEETLGATPAFECEATPKSKIGDYRILASLAASNYEITYKYGILSVVKAPLTATILETSKIYGNKNPDFSLTFTGLKNNETSPEWSVKPKFSTTATIDSGVGQYDVTATDGTAMNYEITKYNPGKLTVTKRDLIAKAVDKERQYGEENPDFEIKYTGFVNGDTSNDLISKPTAKCHATKESNAGQYDIIVNGGEANNYNVVCQNGTLTISPLTVGFKNTTNTVTYYDMSVSNSDKYFNYIPEIIGPYNPSEFDLELYFLDKDNKYSYNHSIKISSGEYAGDYVYTNVVRPMYAGKYIFQLKSNGTNPNVAAGNGRAFLTVNTGSCNFTWNASSSIEAYENEESDLGLSFEEDGFSDVNMEYDSEIIELISPTEESKTWKVKGLKIGETWLTVRVNANKNDMGFYNFKDSPTVSKRIIVKKGSAVDEIQSNNEKSVIGIFDINGHEIIKPENFNGILIIKYSDGTSKKVMRK